MFLRLLLAFTVIPLVELALLLRLGRWLGAWETFGIVLGTGVVGAYLARREGARALGRIQANMNQGIVPTQELVEGCLILVAGVLLVTPGLLTDLVGFTLLIPPARRRIGQYARQAVGRRMTIIQPGGDDDFIDVEPTSSDTGDASP